MLDAQLADRNSERAYNAKLQTYRLIACGAGGVLLLVFLSYALFLGHGAMVFEFAKLLVSAILGAFGGYGYKAHRDSQKHADIKQD